MPNLLVKDVMTVQVPTLHPGDDLATLHDMMEIEHVRYVPIVDRGGQLVGLVTHVDLLRAALAAREDFRLSVQQDLLGSTKIAEIMTTALEVVEPQRDLEEAARLMIENGYGCLPVVDANRLVGILTEADFLRHVAGQGSAPAHP
jgi:CBS domain-containing membrane protein